MSQQTVILPEHQLNNVGSCLKKMQRYGDALIHLKQSLEIYRNISLDEPNNGNTAYTC